jgi:hypothetical protein
MIRLLVSEVARLFYYSYREPFGFYLEGTDVVGASLAPTLYYICRKNTEQYHPLQAGAI